MQFLTASIREQLIANWRDNRREDGLVRDHGYVDHKPVVKLFTPDANVTWLLTEIDPSELDRAYGLCDLGLGSPELGYVSLLELAELRGSLGLPIERDLYFEADKALSAYADEAARLGRIKA